MAVNVINTNTRQSLPQFINCNYNKDDQIIKQKKRVLLFVLHYLYIKANEAKAVYYTDKTLQTFENTQEM